MWPSFPHIAGIVVVDTRTPDNQELKSRIRRALFWPCEAGWDVDKQPRP